ncbi:hypothetical protein QBC34DRAFT_419545 [Podospora aff. communis PSN243]|uniref:Uncharacterized protein n=1 Tax=Podospora aff. communis PSN243 TaxID=3040156 RepID=A0AAV9G357_9PEZI|nr:hypothetical protein QBC34DRAFT_419545 [Podospora aff. communis PSN243]
MLDGNPSVPSEEVLVPNGGSMPSRASIDSPSSTMRSSNSCTSAPECSGRLSNPSFLSSARSHVLSFSLLSPWTGSRALVAGLPGSVSVGRGWEGLGRAAVVAFPRCGLSSACLPSCCAMLSLAMSNPNVSATGCCVVVATASWTNGSGTWLRSTRLIKGLCAPRNAVESNATKSLTMTGGCWATGIGRCWLTIRPTAGFVAWVWVCGGAGL